MLNDVYLVTGSYLAVVLIAVGVLNWLQAGLLFPFLKVRASRGRLILVRIRSVTSDYYKPGEIIEGFLIFKDRKKNSRRIKCSSRDLITRAMGVATVDIDDEKNAIGKPDFSAIDGFDAVKYENLYIRCLTKPGLESTQDKIILALLVVAVLSIIVVGFLVFKNAKAIESLSSITGVV